MRCFRCLVAFQAEERSTIEKAYCVYDGMSPCIEHVNTVRGPSAHNHLRPGSVS